MTEVHLTDQSGDRKYFIMTPQLVWAMVESPFEFTLWSVIKMIAGETGECTLSTRDLARAAMMSKSQVHRCRASLIEKGLLVGELYREPGYDNEVWHMSVPDMWARNILWREQNHSLLERIRAKEEHEDTWSEIGVSLPGTGGGVPTRHGGVPTRHGGVPGVVTKKNHQEEPKEEPPAAREPPAGEAYPVDPDGTFEGMPLVEVDPEAIEYICPWSDCQDGTHPIPRKTARYTTPCGHPLGFLLDGALWIKPKRPPANKEKPRNLQTLLNLDEQDPFASLPYGKTNTTLLMKVWDDKHGQAVARECLGWALFGRGQGIPHHQKVERAFVRIQAQLTAEGRWDTIIGAPRKVSNDEPTIVLSAPADGADASYFSPGL